MLYYFLIVLGIFVFLYSIIEASIYSSLYFDRAIYCPEKFVIKEKASDIVSIIHYLVLVVFGVSCFLTGYNFIHAVDYNILKNIVLICCGFSVVDVLLMFFVDKKYEIKKTAENIQTQWKTQKKITDEHNHEVNMYRAAKRFEKYKKQSVYSMFVVLILLVIM